MKSRYIQDLDVGEIVKPSNLKIINKWLIESPSRKSPIVSIRSLDVNTLLNEKTINNIKSLPNLTKQNIVDQLNNVIIRFDADPELYLKDDYKSLLLLLKYIIDFLQDEIPIDENLKNIIKYINLLKRQIPHYDIVLNNGWENYFVDENYNPLKFINLKYSIDHIRLFDTFEDNILGEVISSGSESISTLELQVYGYLKFTIYARIDSGNSPGLNLSFSLEQMDIDPRTNQITGSEIEIRGNEEFNDIVIDGIGYKKIIFNFKERILKPINIIFKRLNSSTARAKIVIPKIQLAPNVIEIEDINDIFNK